MARPAKKLHEIVPYRKKNSAVVNWRGRPYHLGPWDATRGEPSEAAAKRLAELVALWRGDPDAGAGGLPGDTMLAELWQRWRASPEAEGRLTEQAARAERFLFGTAAEPGPYCHHRATAFRGEELRAFQRALVSAGLSRDSVTKTVRCVRECFAWGLIGRHVGYDQFRELELVPAPPAGKVKEAVKRRGVLWETAELAVGRLSPPLAACCRLLWLTGARPGELLSIRAGEVLTGGSLHAVSGVVLDLTRLGVWGVVRRTHKTDGTEYDRVIFFGPQAQRLLAPILAERRADEHLFRPADGREWDLARKRAGRKPGGYGTYKKRKGGKAKRRPGLVYGSHALTTAVRRACEAGGGPAWTPYQLRHQVSVLVQQRFGRDAARVFLGHQVGGVTERYAGGDLERAAEVARAWG